LNSQGILPITWVTFPWEHWVIVICSVLFISLGIIIWLTKCQGIIQDPLTSLLWWRLLLALIAIALFAIGTTIMVFKILGNIQSPWAIILPIVLNALGVVVVLLQWLFPVPSSEPTSALSPPHAVIPATVPLTLGKTAYRNILGSPPPTLRTIIDRSQTFKAICDQILSADDIAALVLTGIAQSGKTTLAAQVYSYEEGKDHTNNSIFTDKPLWLTIDTAVTMADLTGTLFAAFGETLTNFESLSDSSKALELLNLLKKPNKKRLVILDQLDNVLDRQTGYILEKYTGICEWLDAINSQKCSSRLILTSRLWPKRPYEFFRTYMQEYCVKGMEVDEGMNLLQNQGINAARHKLEEAVNRCGIHAGFLMRLTSLLNHDISLSLLDLLQNQEYSYVSPNIASDILGGSYQNLDNLHRDLLVAFSINPSAMTFNDIWPAIANSNVSSVQARMALDDLLRLHLLIAEGRGLYRLPAIVALAIE
jgi:hypothetical protein